MNKLELLLTTVAVGGTMLLIGHHATAQTPLEELHAGYNHIQVFEDGGYIAETKQGQQERGCISTAICNDRSN